MEGSDHYELNRPEAIVWFTGGQADHGSSIARSAFEKGKEIIKSELPEKDRDEILSSQGTSIRDFVFTILEAHAKYQSRKESKAYLWLKRLSSRVVHYGAVLNVFVQHHPEYVSLVWGTFKFLFTIKLINSLQCTLLMVHEAVVNHAELVKGLAKACSQIADSLPHADLSLILYPTPAMREAVARLYAAIIKFAIRAMRWYQQGKSKHILSAIVSPWSLHYEEELRDIDQSSRNVQDLAQSASRAELRELRFQVHQSRSDQQQARVELMDLKSTVENGFKTVTQHFLAMKSLQTRISNDTTFSRETICQVQLNQILSLPFMESLPTSGQCLAYCRSFWLRRRHAGRQQDNSVVDATSFQRWNQRDHLSFVVVESANATAAQDALVEIINSLRRHGLPVLWALRPPNLQETTLTTIDIIRILLYQALQVNLAAAGTAYPITVAQLREASCHGDWLALFKRALQG
ncbi:hypothetical protein PG985_014641 [Apiospora marii]|uniref:uncharacterized protein n=1 Tax=Apiospora marii TaxID=335849 RepID=UPI00313086B5